MKDTSIYISTTNHKCLILGINKKLMRREVYNGTKSVYAPNKGILFNRLSPPPKKTQLSTITPIQI